MNKRPTVDFVKILESEGVPVTESVIEQYIRDDIKATGSKIANDSTMSPFWRWIKAAIVSPVKWLITVFMASHVLPNMFVATAKRKYLELKAWELGIEPRGKTKTVGNITLTKDSANDVISVPAGTIIQTDLINNKIYQVITTKDEIINEGSQTGKVEVEAVEAGAAYNLPAGYYNILPVEVPGIVAAENEPDWIIELGLNAETDDELASRLQNQFTTQGKWHIDDVYRAIIAKFAGISPDNIFFENTGNTSPGTATAYIFVDVGSTPPLILEKLNKHIMADGNHGHGDQLTCKAMPLKPVNIVCSVVLIDNLTTEQTNEALLEVEERIRAAFRETAEYQEMTRTTPRGRFSLSRLAAEIHTSIDSVISLVFEVDNVVSKDIISRLEIPVLKSLIVNDEQSNG